MVNYLKYVIIKMEKRYSKKIDLIYKYLLIISLHVINMCEVVQTFHSNGNIHEKYLIINGKRRRI